MSQCWALYIITSERCTMDAGHEGDHEIVTSWGDEQCYVPGLPPSAIKQPSVSEPSVFAGEPCIVCDHAWHDEICTFGKCDCMTSP